MVERKRVDVPDIGPGFEVRSILLAHGIDYHIEDIRDQTEEMRKYAISHKDPRVKRYWDKYYEKYYMPPFDYLKNKFEDEFVIVKDRNEMKNIFTKYRLRDLDSKFKSIRELGIYKSKAQKVVFIIVAVYSKDDFKLALETENLHVIYSGHSRYGRGACFDIFTDLTKQHLKGNQWSMGNNRSGLFRLGYPYVPVPLEDIEKHQYLFTPTPVEGGEPPREKKHPFSRHPDTRKSLKKISIPFELQHLIYPPTFESSSNQYYGFTKKEERKTKQYLILRAGWTQTINSPYDLGGTVLKCKVFCHFGCSSRLHYWHIVRKNDYKGWARSKPPTDKYAYFTTAPSDMRLDPLWLYNLLNYDQQNNFKSWWDSLQYAKKEANKKLKSIRSGYKIY